MKPSLPRRSDRLGNKTTVTSIQKVSKNTKRTSKPESSSTRKLAKSLESLTVDDIKTGGLSIGVPHSHHHSEHKDSFRGPDGKLRYHWRNGTYVTGIKFLVRVPKPSDTLCATFERLNLCLSTKSCFQLSDQAIDTDRSSDSVADSDGDSEMSGSSCTSISDDQ
ncbi:MAG: hypothetical protein M1812_001335 [Candelaria pacifica]|nr:MAG: hypothetical protein M1812_001335 [Candelaria pacifica]